MDLGVGGDEGYLHSKKTALKQNRKSLVWIVPSLQSPGKVRHIYLFLKVFTPV